MHRWYRTISSQGVLCHVQGYTLQEPFRGGETVGEMREAAQVTLAHFASGNVGIYTKPVPPFMSKMGRRGQ